MANSQTILGITGTTSVGKSQVAVKLAKMFDTDVISADSMQIYKGMDIGTAKITPEQAQGVKHHLIDVVEPNEDFSSFLYQKLATEIIDASNKVPIVCGGTGFYFDSLLYPPEFEHADDALRNKVKQLYEQKGLEGLVQQLKVIDSATYEKIDCKNPVRVMRALEIALSGNSQSEGTNKERKPARKMMLFVLQRDRESLYKNIHSRVDEMLAGGLENEARALYDKYGRVSNSAFSAIGYKEFYDYFDGKISYEQAVQQIKLNTRHYAKRQISYFKRMDIYEFVDVDSFENIEQIANCIADKYRKYSKLL